MTTEPDLALTGGTIVTPEEVIQGDLCIANGRITSIGPRVTGAKRSIDAREKILLPGGVDPHAHIEQMSGMGQWNADTFETATRSAAMGGTTTVISFAAQAAGERLTETVGHYRARAVRGAMIDHAFHITLTDTDVPRFEADLAALIAAGHRSLKVFTTYNIQLNDTQLLSIFRQAKVAGALVCVHAENDAILADARAQCLAQGKTSPRDHARARPRLAEIEAVERICHFAEYLSQPVMLFHISTAEAAATIREAKARGAPIWAETCPHYLLMTEDVLDKPGIEGAKWMCSPPQRSPADQEALWAALADGTLDLISSDHAPYRFDETGKLAAGANPPFPQIANGMPGLEPRLPLLFDALVSQGRGTLEQFARLTATAAAEIYGLTRKGALAPGMDADVVMWNPEIEVTYGSNDLHDNVGYNPWEGTCVKGWPDLVLLRGDVLVEGGNFQGTPGQGAWLDRPEPAIFPKRTA